MAKGKLGQSNIIRRLPVHTLLVGLALLEKYFMILFIGVGLSTCPLVLVSTCPDLPCGPSPFYFLIPLLFVYLLGLNLYVCVFLWGDTLHNLC